jgi:large repetitive protein
MKAIPNLVLLTHRALLLWVGGMVVLSLGGCGGAGAGAQGQNPAATPITVNAGTAFFVAPGATGNLNCSASGGTGTLSYTWSVLDNGNANVALASASSANATFTAPSVLSNTSMTFMCTATDLAHTSANKSVVVTVVPSLTSSSQTLVADAGPGAVVNPGQQSVTLDGSKSGWYNQSGTSVTGGASLSYLWTTSVQGVTILNPNAPITSFVAPDLPLQSPALTVPFTLTVSGGTQTSTATVNFVVDPYGTLTFTVLPPAQALLNSSGEYSAVTINATAVPTSKTPSLYFQWVQVGGPTVPIGGATTATMGFTPLSVSSLAALSPALAPPITYTFEVCVSYQNNLNGSCDNGIYSALATVTAQ